MKHILAAHLSTRSPPPVSQHHPTHFASASPTQKDIFSGRKIHGRQDLQVIDFRNGPASQLPMRFPQMVETSESQKIGPGMTNSKQWKSQQHLKYLLDEERTLDFDRKASLSPKVMHHSNNSAIKQNQTVQSSATLKFQQDKLKKIVSVTHSQQSSSQKSHSKPLHMSQTVNTTLRNAPQKVSSIDRVSPFSHNKTYNHCVLLPRGSVKPTVKSSKSMVSMQKHSNLHLSQSIDYDSSAPGFIKPMLNQTVGMSTPVSNVGVIHPASCVNLHKKTSPGLSLIPTSTSQQSSSKKDQHFFVSPKMQKRKNVGGTSTAGVISLINGSTTTAVDINGSKQVNREAKPIDQIEYDEDKEITLKGVTAAQPKEQDAIQSSDNKEERGAVSVLLRSLEDKPDGVVIRLKKKKKKKKDLRKKSVSPGSRVSDVKPVEHANNIHHHQQLMTDGSSKKRLERIVWMQQQQLRRSSPGSKDKKKSAGQTLAASSASRSPQQHSKKVISSPGKVINHSSKVASVKVNLFGSSSSASDQPAKNTHANANHSGNEVVVVNKEGAERIRRERIGLGFLKDKNESFVEQMLQKSKERLWQSTKEGSSDAELKAKKKMVLNAERLKEIHRFIASKRRLYEQENQLKFFLRSQKERKIVDNQQQLESNVRDILNRIASRRPQLHHGRLSNNNENQLKKFMKKSQAAGEYDDFQQLYEEYRKILLAQSASTPTSTSQNNSIKNRSKPASSSSSEVTTKLNEKQNSTNSSAQQVLEARGRERTQDMMDRYTDISQRFQRIVGAQKQSIGSVQDATNDKAPLQPAGISNAGIIASSNAQQDVVTSEQLSSSSIIVKENEEGNEGFAARTSTEEDQINFIAIQYLNHSAILIQKIWRGYSTRKLMQLLLEEFNRENGSLQSQSHRTTTETTINNKEDQKNHFYEGNQANEMNGVRSSEDLQLARMESGKRKREALMERDAVTYEEQLIRLKEIEIQKWQMISAHLQNAQSLLNPQERQKVLSSLQELSEQNKNELLNSMNNKQEEVESRNSQQEQQEQQENWREEVQQVQELKQLSKNEVLLLDSQQSNNTGRFDESQQSQQSHMRQELNQLYLLLTQEANKDKDRKYLYSSSLQHSSSNLNSQRNSSRTRFPEELTGEGGLETGGPVSFFERDSFKTFTEKKLKELMRNEQIEEIIRFREQSIQMRHSTQVAVMNKMLSENVVSPRTYHQNKEELDSWAKQEQDEINVTRYEFEKSIKRAIDSISKAKRDVDFSKNCQAMADRRDGQSTTGVNNDAAAAAVQSKDDEEFIAENPLISLESLPRQEQDDIVVLDSEHQVKVYENSPTAFGLQEQCFVSEAKITDIDDTSAEQHVGEEIESRNGQQSTVDAAAVSDISREEEEKEENSNHSSSHTVTTVVAANVHSFTAAEMAAHEVFNTINEEIKEKWKMNAQVEERLNEQLNRVEFIDKSDRLGIASNLFIVEQYIASLLEYIREHYKEELIDNLNTAFGFSPQKRLKLIHGYDSYLDVAGSECSLEEFTTLPFVLSEELFIDFEQNIIGNGEEEKDQIIKEFQHIHNKSIFDTFNESLNLFRPYFALGGSPYSWSYHEKNIVFYDATNTNIESILSKATKKVIEWASFLCGIINDHEIPPAIRRGIYNNEEDAIKSSDSLNELERTNDQSPLLSLLDNNSLQPENEYFAQSREERLSRMLLVEIFENEYKWQLYEDERAEVLMELSDLVFEELVEEIVDELSDAQQSEGGM